MRKRNARLLKAGGLSYLLLDHADNERKNDCKGKCGSKVLSVELFKVFSTRMIFTAQRT